MKPTCGPLPWVIHHPVAGGNDLGDVVTGLAGEGPLVGDGAVRLVQDQRVAPDGEDDEVPRHAHDRNLRPLSGSRGAMACCWAFTRELRRGFR